MKLSLKLKIEASSLSNTKLKIYSGVKPIDNSRHIIEPTEQPEKLTILVRSIYSSNFLKTPKNKIPLVPPPPIHKLVSS